MSPGTSPLCGPGGIPRERADVCGSVKQPNSRKPPRIADSPQLRQHTILVERGRDQRDRKRDYSRQVWKETQKVQVVRITFYEAGLRQVKGA